MSGDAKCPACAMAPRRALHILEPSCTGRPGCVRAAGTQGGATDGMGTRVVEWHGESEITRLRAEVERLTAERDGPVMVALRRVMSGEAAAYMGPEVVILSRAQHDSDHEVVIRLRAEVERWKERAHLAEGAVAVLNRTIDDLNGERDARDRAVAEAVREAAADVVGDNGYNNPATIREIDLDAVIASVKEAQG